PAVRARPTLGDIARAVDMRTSAVAPSVAELTSTSQSVDLPMAYNSTIRKTIKRPPSGKVAVTIEVMLSVTAACRVFFRCGQEAVGGTTQGAQGTVEELVNATADTVPLFQKAVATGVVTIPDNVNECDIVGSLNQSGGAAGNAKYLLDSGSGRRIRMTITPIT
ncbi:hypothetical protein NWP13_23970, partial [Rhodococcus pyridinivorans]|nr:hypothetical protein [Rhodococcus pyridinivorans]